MSPKTIGKGRESLTRKEIIQQMQERLQVLGLPNKTLNQIINAFFEVYKDSILAGDRVEIRGFGIMKSELIRSRLIKHPETKEEIPSSAHYRLSFIPTQTFREQLKVRARLEASKK